MAESTGSEVTTPVPSGPSVSFLQANGLQGAAFAAQTFPRYYQENPEPQILAHNGTMADLETEKEYVEKYLLNVPNLSSLSKDQKYRLKCKAKIQYYKDYLCPKLTERVSRMTGENNQLRSENNMLRLDIEKLRQETFRRWADGIHSDEQWVDEMLASDQDI